MGIVRKFKREIKSIPSISYNMRKRKVVRRTPVKRTITYYKRVSKADLQRKALKPGKRRSASGKVYHETRKNRSDITGKGRKGKGY